MDKDRPRFSVIVPAHNSAGYITKLLDSIRAQSFTDYELIVVCDSCTDNTVETVKRYLNPDDGDQLYEVQYSQDGQTRNVGLDHARGEWILFADDDDWFLHEYVFEMLDKVVGQNDEDVMMFGFIWKGMGYACNTMDRIFVAVWNKCWRRTSIGDTRFSTVPYKSDADFHSAMMQKHLRAVFWDMPLYYYNFLREGSMSKELKDQGVMYREVDYERVAKEGRT